MTTDATTPINGAAAGTYMAGIWANPIVSCNMVVMPGQQKLHLFTVGKDTCLCGEVKVEQGTGWPITP